MIKNKKKILLLSDDLRLNSGISAMSREIVLQLVKDFHVVQLGAALQHPEQGKCFDLSADVANITGVKDASVKIYCNSGYGNPDILRELINIEKPDAILHFTDPRFWGWLYQMEHELRQMLPIVYYTIWDCDPVPYWNYPFYASCDQLLCISKQTYAIVKEVLKDDDYKDWQIKYIPHGINHKTFYPIENDDLNYDKFNEFRNVIRKDKDFVLLFNNRNIRRKHIGDVILAYKEFCKELSKEEASKCLLLLHTDPVDENGTDIPATIKAICTEYDIRFTPKRLMSTEELNWLYNSVDCTINLSDNEGFGLATAESVMAGTPIIVTVTGGLQDQCGFRTNEIGSRYLTEHDYNNEFLTNAVGKYTKHGDWVYPVFPKVRTLQGSPATPYIFADIVDYRDAAKQILNVYNDRNSSSLYGRSYFMLPETGLSAENMGNRFIIALNELFENWKPRERIEIIKL